jgi:hypothetical protein
VSSVGRALARCRDGGPLSPLGKHVASHGNTGSLKAATAGAAATLAKPDPAEAVKLAYTQALIVDL